MGLGLELWTTLAGTARVARADIFLGQMVMNVVSGACNDAQNVKVGLH